MIIAQITVQHPDNFEQLKDYIPSEYLSDSLIGQFKLFLSNKIKTIYIEYPYIDKDYRSTYYAFYAKRHRSYDQFCFRLHLFTQILEKDSDLDVAQVSYLGSIVLRPTEIAPMGRTLLHPQAIQGFSGYVCEAQFENNILGAPFSVHTFPHTMQDTDVTVCAHAVCWMIARYYSEKYSVYPERLTYDIAEAVRDVSFGRNIPSRGLTLGQVSEILTSIGFFPEIFVKELYQKDDFFYDILYSYIESGIPVVGAMRKKEHAIAIVGHGQLQAPQDFISASDNQIFVNTRNLIDSLVVHDDNRIPFKTIFTSGGEYCISDIDAFVVPLYEKMYLNAENVLGLYTFFAQSSLLSISEKQLISRIYMTSSRSYKRELRNDGKISSVMRKSQLELPMPKFIWIVELATPEQYNLGLTDYRFVIDSTANQYEAHSFLFIHDKEKMIIHDRALTGKMFVYDFDDIIEPYSLYTNNLQWREA